MALVLNVKPGEIVTVGADPRRQMTLALWYDREDRRAPVHILMALSPDLPFTMGRAASMRFKRVGDNLKPYLLIALGENEVVQIADARLWWSHSPNEAGTPRLVFDAARDRWPVGRTGEVLADAA